jgi:hypothetical protein
MYCNTVTNSTSFTVMAPTCERMMWDVDAGTQRDSRINFYNRYLLLLEEHTDEHAIRQGAPDEHRQSFDHSGLACGRDSDFPCVGSYVTVRQP